MSVEVYTQNIKNGQENQAVQIQACSGLQQMCKKYIIQIEEDQPYPFDGPKTNCEMTIVRKNIIFCNSERENTIVQRLKLLLSLSSPYFIHVTRILERKNQYFTIDYQYVPQNLAKCQKLVDQAFLLSVKDNLIQLCQALSQSCMKTVLKIDDIGVTEEGQPKVFIPYLFELVPQNQKPDLKREYQSQIEKILEPYFSFKAFKRAPSELSDYSARLDKKIAAIQNKIQRRKYGKSKSRDSSKQQKAKSIEQHQNKSKKPNIVLESITSKLSKASQSPGKTTYSFIDPQKVVKPRTHKLSFNDYTTTSHKLDQSTHRDDSLTKRLSTALQKSKLTFKIYQKYLKHNNRL